MGGHLIERVFGGRTAAVIENLFNSRVVIGPTGMLWYDDTW